MSQISAQLLALLANANTGGNTPAAQPQTSGPTPVDPQMAALAAAANNQAVLPGNQTAQPMVDPETGEPIMEARRGSPKNLQDFGNAWHRNESQSPTGQQARHQGPVNQAIESHVDAARSGGGGASDPTADEQREATGLYQIPTSANEPRQAMQVPQHLLDNDNFRIEMDNAAPGDRQAIVDRYTANSQTEVEKQNAAYEQQQAGVRAFNAQHPLTEPWTVETGNGPRHALTTFQPQNSGAAMFQPGQPQSPIGPNQATGEPMGQNTGASMFQGQRPGGSQTVAPPWAQRNGNQVTWTDQQVQAASNATQLAKSLGLTQPQQDQLSVYAAQNPGMTQSQIQSVATHLQSQNAAAVKETAAQQKDVAKQQREQQIGYHQSQLRQKESAVKTFDAAKKYLEEHLASGDPTVISPIEQQQKDITDAVSAYQSANTALNGDDGKGGINGNISKAEHDLGYDQLPTTQPAQQNSSGVIQPSQRGAFQNSGGFGGGKGSIKADPQAMQQFYTQAKGDRNLAWQLAQQAGYTE
jgi:hypothetical protein